VRTAIFGTSVGAGVVIAEAIYKLSQSQPALLLEVVRGWGALGIIGIVGMVLWSRQSSETLAVTRESAAAQQSLADAVRESASKSAEAQTMLAEAARTIAQKDDLAAKERELLLNHLSYSMKQALEKLDAIDAHLPSGSASSAASAGGQ
jgi:hypothetical protein